MMLSRVLNPLVAIPQDHGSWVFLLTPLSIGLFAGGWRGWSSLFLVVSAFLVFLVRQPVTVLVKVISGRKPSRDLAPAIVWMVTYTVLLLLALSGLVVAGNWAILLLAVPALPVFAFYLLLVSRRAERRQPGIEILATGILALVAPAALWVGKQAYNPVGWLLWLLAWLQSSASIVHAYMRLEQRTMDRDSRLSALFRLGRRAILYTGFNLLLSVFLGVLGVIPLFIFIPYLVQWGETLWCIYHPAMDQKPTRIGLRQLVVSVIFTILFIVFWRLNGHIDVG